MVPDLCTFNVDIRLTPALDDPAAVALLRTTAADIDTAWPGTPPTRVEVTTRWPPYALPDGSPLRDALLEAAAWAGWPQQRRSPGRPTSETIWHGWVSLLPPGSASTTTACTALTSAFA